MIIIIIIITAKITITAKQKNKKKQKKKKKKKKMKILQRRFHVSYCHPNPAIHQCILNPTSQLFLGEG